jgi:phosphoenolpyruvate-protein kinase (PTS system EI component)
MKTVALRGISLFVSVAFTVTTIIWDPSTALASIGSLELQAQSKFQKELQSYLYSVPAEIGTVKGTYFGERGTGNAERNVSRSSFAVSRHDAFVVLIQDAHANPEGQQNVAAMMSYLEAKYPDLAIGLEGAVGELHPENLDLFNEFPDANRAVVEDLKAKGELNGAEIYLLEQRLDGGWRMEDGDKQLAPSAIRLPPSVFGVEDAGLYRANLQTYRDLLSKRDEIQTFLNPVRAQIEKESSQKLNGELRGFLKERSRRKEGRFDVSATQADPNLQAYIRYLQKQSLKHLEVDLKDPIEQLRFPSLLRVVMLEEAQKGFDPEKAKSQWAEVVGTLEAVAIDKDEKSFVESFAVYGKQNRLMTNDQRPTKQAGKSRQSIVDSRWSGAQSAALYPRKLLEGLFRFGKNHKLSFTGQEAFWQSWKLSVLQTEIDVTELLQEMSVLEGGLIQKLAKSEDDKALVHKIENLDLLEKMLRLEVSRPEYDKALAEQGALNSLIASSKPLTAFLNKAYAFYGVSLKRDEALVGNLLGERETGNGERNVSRFPLAVPRVFVLYTGGFHTPGIEAILRQKGIGYAVMTPRITKTDHGQMYQNVISDANADLSAYFKVKNPFLTKQEALIFKQAIETAAPVLSEKYQLNPEQVAASVAQAVSSSPVFSGTLKAEQPKDQLASVRFAPEASLGISTSQNSAVMAIPAATIGRAEALLLDPIQQPAIGQPALVTFSSTASTVLPAGTQSETGSLMGGRSDSAELRQRTDLTSPERRRRSEARIPARQMAGGRQSNVAEAQKGVGRDSGELRARSEKALAVKALEAVPSSNSWSDEISGDFEGWEYDFQTQQQSPRAEEEVIYPRVSGNMLEFSSGNSMAPSSRFINIFTQRIRTLLSAWPEVHIRQLGQSLVMRAGDRSWVISPPKGDEEVTGTPERSRYLKTTAENIREAIRTSKEIVSRRAETRTGVLQGTKDLGQAGFAYGPLGAESVSVTDLKQIQTWLTRVVTAGPSVAAGGALTFFRDGVSIIRVSPGARRSEMRGGKKISPEEKSNYFVEGQATRPGQVIGSASFFSSFSTEEIIFPSISLVPLKIAGVNAVIEKMDELTVRVKKGILQASSGDEAEKAVEFLERLAGKIREDWVSIREDMESSEGEGEVSSFADGSRMPDPVGSLIRQIREQRESDGASKNIWHLLLDQTRAAALTLARSDVDPERELMEAAKIIKRKLKQQELVAVQRAEATDKRAGVQARLGSEPGFEEVLESMKKEAASEDEMAEYMDMIVQGFLKDVHSYYFGTPEAFKGTLQRMQEGKVGFTALFYHDVMVKGVKAINYGKALFPSRRNAIDEVRKKIANEVISVSDDILVAVCSAIGKTTQSYELEGSDAGEGTVLFVREFMGASKVADLWENHGHRIKAIVTDAATFTTHWVLFLKGIANPPLILIVDDEEQRRMINGIKPGSKVLVAVDDPVAGRSRVYRDPTLAQIREAEKENRRLGMLNRAQRRQNTLSPGRIGIYANVSPGGSSGIRESGADGTGLTRTEIDAVAEESMILMAQLKAAGKEEEFLREAERFQRFLEHSYEGQSKDPSLKGKPNTWRAFDLWPDKNADLFQALKELGLPDAPGFDFFRSPLGAEILKRQIAAFLTLEARFGDAPDRERPLTRLMLPHVNTVEDARYFDKEILSGARIDAAVLLGGEDASNRVFEAEKKIRFGAMIETPEAVKNMKEILGYRIAAGTRLFRFVSVGTNDMEIRMLSDWMGQRLSRDYPWVARFLKKLYPLYLKQYEKIIRNAMEFNSDPANILPAEENVAVGFCGEVAGMDTFLSFLQDQDDRYNSQKTVVPLSASMSSSQIHHAKTLLRLPVDPGLRAMFDEGVNALEAKPDEGFHHRIVAQVTARVERAERALLFIEEYQERYELAGLENVLYRTDMDVVSGIGSFRDFEFLREMVGDLEGLNRADEGLMDLTDLEAMLPILARRNITVPEDEGELRDAFSFLRHVRETWAALDGNDPAERYAGKLTRRLAPVFVEALGDAPWKEGLSVDQQVSEFYHQYYKNASVIFRVVSHGISNYAKEIVPLKVLEEGYKQIPQEKGAPLEVTERLVEGPIVTVEAGLRYDAFRYLDLENADEASPDFPVTVMNFFKFFSENLDPARSLRLGSKIQRAIRRGRQGFTEFMSRPSPQRDEFYRIFFEILSFDASLGYLVSRWNSSRLMSLLLPGFHEILYRFLDHSKFYPLQTQTMRAFSVMEGLPQRKEFVFSQVSKVYQGVCAKPDSIRTLRLAMLLLEIVKYRWAEAQKVSSETGAGFSEAMIDAWVQEQVGDILSKMNTKDPAISRSVAWLVSQNLRTGIKDLLYSKELAEELITVVNSLKGKESPAVDREDAGVLLEMLYVMKFAQRYAVVAPEKQALLTQQGFNAPLPNQDKFYLYGKYLLENDQSYGQEELTRIIHSDYEKFMKRQSPVFSGFDRFTESASLVGRLREAAVSETSWKAYCSGIWPENSVKGIIDGGFEALRLEVLAPDFQERFAVFFQGVTPYRGKALSPAELVREWVLVRHLQGLSTLPDKRRVQETVLTLFEPLGEVHGAEPIPYRVVFGTGYGDEDLERIYTRVLKEKGFDIVKTWTNGFRAEGENQGPLMMVVVGFFTPKPHVPMTRTLAAVREDLARIFEVKPRIQSRWTNIFSGKTDRRVTNRSEKVYEMYGPLVIKKPQGSPDFPTEAVFLEDRETLSVLELTAIDRPGLLTAILSILEEHFGLRVTEPRSDDDEFTRGSFFVSERHGGELTPVSDDKNREVVETLKEMLDASEATIELGGKLSTQNSKGARSEVRDVEQAEGEKAVSLDMLAKTRDPAVREALGRSKTRIEFKDAKEVAGWVANKLTEGLNELAQKGFYDPETGTMSVRVDDEAGLKAWINWAFGLGAIYQGLGQKADDATFAAMPEDVRVICKQLTRGGIMSLYDIVNGSPWLFLNEALQKKAPEAFSSAQAKIGHLLWLAGRLEVFAGSEAPVELFTPQGRSEKFIKGLAGLEARDPAGFSDEELLVWFAERGDSPEAITENVKAWRAAHPIDKQSDTKKRAEMRSEPTEAKTVTRPLEMPFDEAAKIKRIFILGYQSLGQEQLSYDVKHFSLLVPLLLKRFPNAQLDLAVDFFPLFEADRYHGRVRQTSVPRGILNAAVEEGRAAGLVGWMEEQNYDWVFDFTRCGSGIQEALLDRSEAMKRMANENRRLPVALINMSPVLFQENETPQPVFMIDPNQPEGDQLSRVSGTENVLRLTPEGRAPREWEMILRFYRELGLYKDRFNLQLVEYDAGRPDEAENEWVRNKLKQTLYEQGVGMGNTAEMIDGNRPFVYVNVFSNAASELSDPADWEKLVAFILKNTSAVLFFSNGGYKDYADVTKLDRLLAALKRRFPQDAQRFVRMENLNVGEVLQIMRVMDMVMTPDKSGFSDIATLLNKPQVVLALTEDSPDATYREGSIIVTRDQLNDLSGVQLSFDGEVERRSVLPLINVRRQTSDQLQATLKRLTAQERVREEDDFYKASGIKDDLHPFRDLAAFAERLKRAPELSVLEDIIRKFIQIVAIHGSNQYVGVAPTVLLSRQGDWVDLFGNKFTPLDAYLDMWAHPRLRTQFLETEVRTVFYESGEDTLVLAKLAELIKQGHGAELDKIFHRLSGRSELRDVAQAERSLDRISPAGRQWTVVEIEKARALRKHVLKIQDERIHALDVRIKALKVHKPHAPGQPGWITSRSGFMHYNNLIAILHRMQTKVPQTGSMRRNDVQDASEMVGLLTREYAGSKSEREISRAVREGFLKALKLTQLELDRWRDADQESVALDAFLENEFYPQLPEQDVLSYLGEEGAFWLMALEEVARRYKEAKPGFYRVVKEEIGPVVSEWAKEPLSPQKFEDVKKRLRTLFVWHKFVRLDDGRLAHNPDLPGFGEDHLGDDLRRELYNLWEGLDFMIETVEPLMPPAPALVVEPPAEEKASVTPSDSRPVQLELFPRSEVRLEGTVAFKSSLSSNAEPLSVAPEIPAVAERIGVYSAPAIAADLDGGVTEDNLRKARLYITDQLLTAFRTQQNVKGKVDNPALQKVLKSLESYRVTGAKDAAQEERGVHVALPVLNQMELEALAGISPVFQVLAIALNAKLYLNAQVDPKGIPHLKALFMDAARRNGITMGKKQFEIFSSFEGKGGVFTSREQAGVPEDALLAAQEAQLPDNYDRATLWYNSKNAQLDMKTLAAEITEALYAALDQKVSKGAPRDISTYGQQLTAAIVNAIQASLKILVSA